MSERPSEQQTPPPEQPPLTPPAQIVSPWMVLSSVFRAWFGVQTESNRQRDFGSNNASSFIIAGIIFVIFMVCAVMVVVNVALSGHTQ